MQVDEGSSALSEEQGCASRQISPNEPSKMKAEITTRSEKVRELKEEKSEEAEVAREKSKALTARLRELGWRKHEVDRG